MGLAVARDLSLTPGAIPKIYLVPPCSQRGRHLADRYGMTVDSHVHHDDVGNWDGSERRRPFIGVRTEDDARVVTQRGQARALLAWRMTDAEAHQDAAGGLG